MGRSKNMGKENLFIPWWKCDRNEIEMENIRSSSNISAKIFYAHTGKFEGDETRVCPRRDPSR
jgi:hypothetical protein